MRSKRIRAIQAALAMRVQEHVCHALLKRLEDEDAVVRRSAVEVLAKIPTPEVLQALYGMLDDSSPRVRHEAEFSIQEIQDHPGLLATPSAPAQRQRPGTSETQRDRRSLICQRRRVPRSVAIYAPLGVAVEQHCDLRRRCAIIGVLLWLGLYGWERIHKPRISDGKTLKDLFGDLCRIHNLSRHATSLAGGSGRALEARRDGPDLYRSQPPQRLGKDLISRCGRNTGI